MNLTSYIINTGLGRKRGDEMRCEGWDEERGIRIFKYKILL
jgi:hypothetical protein